jgi:hypothetical protein
MEKSAAVFKEYRIGVSENDKPWENRIPSMVDAKNVKYSIAPMKENQSTHFLIFFC